VLSAQLSDREKSWFALRTAYTVWFDARGWMHETPEHIADFDKLILIMRPPFTTEDGSETANSIGLGKRDGKKVVLVKGLFGSFEETAIPADLK
jgi:hypothetical protein